MVGFDVPAWGDMFIPDLSLVESFLRGSIVYLSLVVFCRLILKRQTGSLGLPDVMFVVLLSECVSPALSAEANSIPNALAAVSAILFWNYALDRLGHRWPWLQRWLEPQPLLLIKDGKPLRDNMDAEGITEDELAAQLRLNGIDNLAKVKLAVMEADGEVSVVPQQSTEVRNETDGAEQQPSGMEPDVSDITRRFLAAAVELQKAVEWHEGRAMEHRSTAKTARQLLTKYGSRRIPRSADGTATLEDSSIQSEMQ